MTETMISAIMLGMLGLVFMYFGYQIWKKENITLLHSYHHNKVSSNNKKRFCKISGWGVLFIGIGLFITGIIVAITDSALSFIAFLVGFVVGIILLVYAGIKYNTTIHTSDDKQ